MYFYHFKKEGIENSILNGYPTKSEWNSTTYSKQANYIYSPTFIKSLISKEKKKRVFRLTSRGYFYSPSKVLIKHDTFNI